MAATFPDGRSFGGALRSQFDTAAREADFAGTYRGRIIAGSIMGGSYPGTVVVAADGTMTQVAGSCTTTGRLRPLRDGQVMAIEVTSVGLSCIEDASGVSHTGIAVLDAGASPVRLYIMTRRADEAAGGYQFVGLR